MKLTVSRFIAGKWPLALLACATLGVGAAFAQNQEEDEEGQPRRDQTISQEMYKNFEEVQVLVDEGKLEEAFAQLRQLETRADRYTPYERAILFQQLGYMSYERDLMDDAIRYYERVAAETEIPEAMIVSAHWAVAQFYFAEEEYRRSIEWINKWFGLVLMPTEQAYRLLGQAYYALDEYSNALEPFKRVMTMIKDRGEIPRENDYLLLRATYFGLDDYENLLAIMKEMIEFYPQKTEYWMTLAGILGQLEQTKAQMAILENLYERGELTTENHLLNLANLYMLFESPYKAARVIDKGMEDGTIEPTVRTLRYLAQCWRDSQEHERALAPLERAARLSDEGDVAYELGTAYYTLDRHDEAEDALERALDKGGLRRADQVAITLAMARLELKDYQGAIRALDLARRDERSVRLADQWRKYIDTEVERRRILEDDSFERAQEAAFLQRLKQLEEEADRLSR